MRDSQSLLDQAVSYSGMEIKDQDLQAILGAIPQETLRAFADGLLAHDASRLLEQVDSLLEQGQDMRQLLAGVVEHIRNLIVTRVAKDPGQSIEIAAADLELLKQQAAGTDSERLILLFDSLSRTLDEMRWSPNQRFTLEVGFVKACSLAPLKPLGEVVERMRTLEARLAGSGPAADVRHGVVAEQPARYIPPSKPQAAVASGGDPWAKVLAALKQKRPNIAPAFAGSKVIEQTADALTVGIKGSSFQLELAEKKENRELVEQIAAEVLARQVSVAFRLVAGEHPQAAPRPATTKRPPAAEPDPFTKDALSIFNGQIIEPEGKE
jgi:DNA polymerase-3 subunit gamma/tau